jgi:hypothetical protein
MQITRQLRRFGIPLVTFKRAAPKLATVTVVALCPPPPPQKKKVGHSEAGLTPEPVRTFYYLFIYFWKGNKFIPPSLDSKPRP